MLSILGLALVAYSVYWVSTSDHVKAVAFRAWLKEKLGEK